MQHIGVSLQRSSWKRLRTAPRSPRVRTWLPAIVFRSRWRQSRGSRGLGSTLRPRSCRSLKDQLLPGWGRRCQPGSSVLRLASRRSRPHAAHGASRTSSPAPVARRRPLKSCPARGSRPLPWRRSKNRPQTQSSRTCPRPRTQASVIARAPPAKCSRAPSPLSLAWVLALYREKSQALLCLLDSQPARRPEGAQPQPRYLAGPWTIGELPTLGLSEPAPAVALLPRLVLLRPSPSKSSPRKLCSSSKSNSRRHFSTASRGSASLQAALWAASRPQSGARSSRLVRRSLLLHLVSPHRSRPGLGAVSQQFRRLHGRRRRQPRCPRARGALGVLPSVS
mmetsp:Transcript_123030/g.262515  ORF Transcript_123030/g.262515 Transcript_123030/m.262515 type:complete len:336 (-) Transcript_123030:510-1517(-)